MSKIFTKRLFFSCLKGCVIVLSFLFFSAVSVHASAGQVGTHVSYGDPDAQVNIIRFVKNQNPPPNYPITVLINLYAGDDEIRKITSELHSGSFAVTLRIMGITVNSSPSDVETLVSRLKGITWTQAKKPMIVFGNELNAYRGVEWGTPIPSSVTDAANEYRPLLAAFADALSGDTTYDLAGVALDPYHEDRATVFISQAQTAFASPRVNSFATNVYEGVAGVGGQNLQAGLDLYNHLASFSPKSRKIFTEFGIDPKNLDASAHIAFYNKYEVEPIPGGFEYATALLPNFCDDNVGYANQWYFYIVGKIYNDKLEEINKDCVTQTPGGTFIYPGPVDAYYNTPGSIDDKAAKFSQVIANDYLLTCSPQIQFKPSIQPSDKNVSVTVGGKKALVNLIEHCSSSTFDEANCLFNVADQTVSVIAEGGSIPLIRSNLRGRTSSLEGFFTSDLEGLASETAQNDFSRSILLQSPSSRMLPRNTICQENISFLKAIETTCEAIPSINDQGKLVADQNSMQREYYANQNREFNECALNGTVYDTQHSQILSDVRANSPDGNELEYCNSSAFETPTDAQREISSLVMNVQPITPKAYRIGYIVVYVSARDNKEFSSQEMISRITRPMVASYLKNIFKIIPILVPANFGMQEENIVRDNLGDPIVGASFDGPFKRTIGPLMTDDFHKEVMRQAQENKAEVAGKMGEFKGETVNDTGMVWLPYCDGTVAMSLAASGLEPADAKLHCSFADYINANLNLGDGNILKHTEQLAPCRFYESTTGGETANIIKSPIRPEWLSDDFESTLESDTTSKVNVFGRIYSNSQSSDMIFEEDAKLRVFLAVPEAEFGLIKDYEQPLLKTLLGEDVFDAVEAEIETSDSELNGYLRMLGVELSVDGGSPKPFFGSIVPDLTNPENPFNQFEVNAQFGVQGDANPVLWGGWLSKFVYTYTANVISTPEQKPFSAFDLTQRRLEPYWLSGGQPGSVDNDPSSVACMNLWIEHEQAVEHANYLMQNIENQRQLWANYYSGYLREPIRSCYTGPSTDYGPEAIQYLFETIPECGNRPCYQYILEKTLAKSHVDEFGKIWVVDPYIAISIALNENGGLKTARKDLQSQHFGVVTPRENRVKECSNDNEYLGGITEKLDIMLNTLMGDYGKTGVAALKEYGYKDGGSAMIRITNLLSSGGYSPACAN